MRRGRAKGGGLVAALTIAHLAASAHASRMVDAVSRLDPSAIARDAKSTATTATGQQACAPSSIPWATYTPSAGAPKTAAVYTPYDIIYGGGESYLLQSIASLQSFGYAVDILVDPVNLARSVDDVMRTAKGLRVDLKRAGLRLRHVAHAGSELVGVPGSYSIFYLIFYPDYMSWATLSGKKTSDRLLRPTLPPWAQPTAANPRQLLGGGGALPPRNLINAVSTAAENSMCMTVSVAGNEKPFTPSSQRFVTLSTVLSPKYTPAVAVRSSWARTPLM